MRCSSDRRRFEGDAKVGLLTYETRIRQVQDLSHSHNEREKKGKRDKGTIWGLEDDLEVERCQDPGSNPLYMRLSDLN